MGGLRSSFEQIQRQHPGELDRRREDGVRAFLKAFLSPRLGIETGEIAAADEPLLTAISVGPANEHDGQHAGTLIDQELAERRPQRIIGDTAYGNIECREALEERSVEVLAPLDTTSPRDGTLPKDARRVSEPADRGRPALCARCGPGIERLREAAMAEQQRDAIEVLEHDHREVEQMFTELESLRGASTEDAKSRRRDLTDRVTIELVRHSVAEEVLVYPQVEDKVSTEEAEHAREEHAEAEETLQRLEKLNADDPTFDDELATLMAEIRHHIGDEEGQMFAHMRQVIDAEELSNLGARVEAFKKVAPTRPHPNVPNEPLPRTAAGPAASLFDRMRDLATGRGTGD